MTSFLDTFGSTRTETLARAGTRRRQTDRTPVLTALVRVLAIVLGTLAARLQLTFSAVRRAALSLTGLGLICYAAWSWNHIAGIAAAGLSLLVIEALSSRTGSGE